MKPLLIKGTKVSLHVESVGHEPHLIFMDSGSWCCPSLTAVRHLWAIICKRTHDSRYKEFKWVRCCQVEGPGFFTFNIFPNWVLFQHQLFFSPQSHNSPALSKSVEIGGGGLHTDFPGWTVRVYSWSLCVSGDSQPCHVAYLFTCLSVNLPSASAPHFW